MKYKDTLKSDRGNLVTGIANNPLMWQKLLSKIKQPTWVAPEMWGIYKRWQNRGGGKLQCRAQNENLRSGWQPLTPPAALLHLEIQKIRLSLQSVTAPVDNDNDLFTMQLASKWEQFSFTPRFRVQRNIRDIRGERRKEERLQNLLHISTFTLHESSLIFCRRSNGEEKLRMKKEQDLCLNKN